MLTDFAGFELEYQMGGVTIAVTEPALILGVIGTSGSDSLTGTTATEIITGLGSEDTIDGGGGNDSIYGGNGEDILTYHFGDQLFGGYGNDMAELDLQSSMSGVAFNFLTGGGVFHGIENVHGIFTNYDDTVVLGHLGQFGVVAQTSLIAGAGFDRVSIDYRFVAEGTTITINEFRPTLGPALSIYASTGMFVDLYTFEKFNIFTTAGHDEITVTSGSYIVHAGAEGDYLSMGTGDDLIFGEAGDDVLYGNGGSDRLYGGDGNDQISGGRDDGIDKLYGGAGDDRFYDIGPNDFAYGGLGFDWASVDYSAKTTAVSVGTGGRNLIGIERISGGLSAHNDFASLTVVQTRFDEPAEFNLYGGDGIDTLALNYSKIVAAGWDHVIFDAGISMVGIYANPLPNQTRYRNFEKFAIIASAGDDILTGGTRADTLSGMAGDDSINGKDGADRLFGGAGNDSLEGGDGSYGSYDGNDTLYGGIGSDSVFSGRGNDVIFGGAGDDEAQDYLGNNAIYGGDGNDTVFAAGGENLVTGGAGNDYLTAGDGKNRLYGGTGADTVTSGNGADILSGGDGHDKIEGGGGADSLYGGAGHDYLITGDGINRAYGGDGNDTLLGGTGADFLSGGAGRDIIVGGVGNDLMFGNLGADIFIFEGNSASGADRIIDFTSGVDRVWLSGGLTAADITVTQGADFAKITWASGSITLTDYSASTVLVAFDADFL